LDRGRWEAAEWGEAGCSTGRRQVRGYSKEWGLVGGCNIVTEMGGRLQCGKIGGWEAGAWDIGSWEVAFGTNGGRL
jgi:hypothetical protein